eukprot:jgi/Galph1/5216/GphlegSOOS_G3845.1
MFLTAINNRQTPVEKLTQQINHWRTAIKPSKQAWVTLSYAQSIDGNIAIPGQRTNLSCPPATVFTHQLRASHDYILIGIDTLMIDNPQLTVRYTADGRPLKDEESRQVSPIPVILDSKLQIPLECHLLQSRNARKPPILFTSMDSYASEKCKHLEKEGIQVIPSPLSSDVEYIPLEFVFQQLTQLYHNFHIRKQEVSKSREMPSILVEGGARIIRSLVLQPEWIDLLIVITCPIYLIGGLPSSGYSQNIIQQIPFQWKCASFIGDDMILVGAFDHSNS